MDDKCPSLRNFILKSVSEKEDSLYGERQKRSLKPLDGSVGLRLARGEHIHHVPGALSLGQVLLALKLPD